MAGGLFLSALIPCLILALVWFGSTDENQPRATALPQSKTLTRPVLTAPGRIEAAAGETIQFPLALDGTDGVPPKSIVAIKGLPQGANFSEGSTYGEGEWRLMPDQIGDLNLSLPAGARGEFELEMAVVAPDGKTVAGAVTLLAVVHAPAEETASTDNNMTLPSATEATAPTPSMLPEFGPAPSLYLLSPSGAGTGQVPAAAAGEDNGIASEDPATTGAIPSDAALTAEAEPSPEATAPVQGGSPNIVGEANETDTDLGTVTPAVFVNLRAEASSSAPVLGVVAKGTNLPVFERKRGWVRVKDPASGKQGWIYSGLLVGAEKPQPGSMRVAPPEAEEKTETFWGRVGRWLRPWKQS